MSYCLNPYCSRPQNPDSGKFCSNCGFKLLLGDRYRPLKLLGRGGFGRTFLAIDEHKPSRPQCVIKQFFPQHQSPENPELARELFLREAVQLEHLGSHPQIPDLFAHFEQEDYQYLVQEFIDGQDLREEVRQRGPFNEVQIWYLLNDLLPVLEFIHQHQVIHRDIKPQNIIHRSVSPHYVLVDFGAAKSIDSTGLGRTGTSIGSPEFTAPEQAMGKATYASDLYSLGVTCIYLLTQVRPADLFDTGEGRWVWRQHLEAPSGSALEAILDRLLQGPMKLRYQSAPEVLQDLQDPKLREALGIATGGEPAASRSLEAAVRSQAAPIASSENLAPEAEVTQLPATMLQVSKAALGWRCEATLLGHQSWVRSVAVHPQGTTLASGSGDHTIKFWDLETGALQRTLQAHESWVRAIALSPEGDLLASCSNDKTVKLWNWETGELLRTLTGHTDWVRSIAFSPDGQLLASSSQDQSIHLWEVKTGRLLKVLKGHVHWVVSVIFAQPSAPELRKTSCLISGSRDKTIRVWNWQTGEQTAILEGHTDAVNGLALAVSTNGGTLASGSDDGTVRIWNLETQQLLYTLTAHESAVHSVAIAADNQTLISGGQDRTVRLWNLQTGTLLSTLTGHANWVWSVAVSPDGGTIASGSWDGTIKLWRKQGC